MAEIVNQVRDFISANFMFGAGEGALADDDSFLDRGIIDSTGILEVVAWIEATFGCKVTDEELVPDNLDSVNQLAAFIARKRG